MRRALFLIFVLYLCLCSLSYGDSEEGQAPKIFSNSPASSQTEIKNGGTTPSSISINANFPDDYGAMAVKKSSNPSYKDYYLLNKTYSIKVEISGIGRPVDNITVKEKIDPSLKIEMSPPFPNIVDPFNDLSLKYLEKTDPQNLGYSAKENYSVDYKNNIIILKIGRLKPKQCIRYNFNITSDKTGVFPASTLVRIAGDTSKLNDINVPFDIEVRPPTFEAHLEKSSSQVIAGDSLNITYNIIHKSGWCTDPFRLNVRIRNSTNNEYILYRCGKVYTDGEQISTSFNTLKYSPINATIKYSNGGSQLLPEIFVEDQVISIPYEEREIYVYGALIEKLIDEYAQTCATIIGILALFFTSIAIILAYKDIKIAREDIKIAKEGIQNGRDEIYIMHKQLCIMDKELHIMDDELAIMKNRSDIENHLGIPDYRSENVSEYLLYVDEDRVPRLSYDFLGFNPQSKP